MQHDAFPYDTPVVRTDGTTTTLGEHRGRVLLVVNTASQCGFTPQYEGLQRLHERFHDQGLDVLAFPCNQFGNQGPETGAAIGAFCTDRFGVGFPVFERIEVNGAGAHPLFRHLKGAAPGWLGTQAIKWNFTKFLVDRSGRVAGRYGPMVPPERLEEPVRRLLERHS